MDYFNSPGDSGSFVCGILGSAGIEEGTAQVYAIPSGISYNIVDPSPSQSTIMITRVEEVSGQLTFFEYLLNAATQGYLNYTLTPSNSGLSISAGDNSLNASVTCFSATQQGYSVSDVLTAQIDAGQNVNLTAPCLASFTASKNVVGKGYAIPVNVTITNVGNNPENVSLTLYANSTTLDTETVFNLLNGTSTTLVFVGNTSSCAYGNYTLSIYCEPSGVNEAANNFTYTGIVEVTIPGDITGPNGWPDGKVDMRDIGLVARNFGLNVPPANPNCDLTGPTAGVPDGKIDMRDIGLVARHFGETDP
jgi:hypothetical protein